MTNTMTAEAVQFNTVELKDLFTKIGKRAGGGMYANAIAKAVKEGFATIQDGKRGASGNAIKKYAEDNKLDRKDFRVTETTKEEKKYLILFYVPTFSKLK